MTVTELRPVAQLGGTSAAGRHRCPHCGGSMAPAASPGGGDLTPREIAVLDLLSEGLTDRQIARRLGISPRTVDTHLGHAYTKLGVRGRTAAVASWLRAGLATA